MTEKILACAAAVLWTLAFCVCPGSGAWVTVNTDTTLSANISNDRYSLRASNMTLTNTGDYIYTTLLDLGSIGMISNTEYVWGAYTGQTVVNQGTIAATNIYANSTGGVGIINMGYTSGRYAKSNQTVINDTDGVITGVVTSGVEGHIMAISIWSADAGSSLAENRGTINMTNNVVDDSLYGINFRHYSSNASKYTAINSGTINLSTSQDIELYGIYGSIKGLTSETTRIENSGTINLNYTGSVSGTGNGIRFYSNYEHHTVVSNSGTINLQGSVSDSSNGIFIDNTVASSTNTISNTGTIQAGSGGTAAAIYTTLGIDSLTTSGTLNGYIHLGGAGDIFSMTGGTVTGNLYTDNESDADSDGLPDEAASDGADTVTVSSGAFTGNIYMAGGNDSAALSGGSITGDIYGQSGDDEFNWTGGEFNSEFHGGDGSDVVLVSAADYDGHQVLDGGDDIDTADTWIDTLTLSGVTGDTAGTNIINWEEILINGGSVIGLSGELAAGTVTIDAAALGIAASASNAALTAETVNNGTIDLTTGAGGAGKRFQITGSYAGTGTLAFDTNFADGVSDVLGVTGTVTADGEIYIASSSTTGRAYRGMITLIEESTDADKRDETFIFAETNRYNGIQTHGRFAGSPYIWELSTSANDWIIDVIGELPVEKETPTEPETNDTENPAVVSEIPAEITLPNAAYEIAFNKLDTLHQRLGELRRHNAGVSVDPAVTRWAGLFPAPPAFDEKRLNGWIKATYARFDFDVDAGFEAQGQYGVGQAGFDLKLDVDTDVIYAGFYGSYIDGSYDNSGDGKKYYTLYSAHTDLYGWSAGLYATWMNRHGTYMDLVLDCMRLDADIKTVDHLSTHGTTWNGSIEIGQSLMPLPRRMPGLVIEPQVQLKIADVKWDDFQDGYNTVHFENHTFLTGRAGVRAEYTFITGRYRDNEIKPWLYIGVRDEFNDDAPAVTNVIKFYAQNYDTTGVIRAGITVKLSHQLQIYGNFGCSSDFDDYRSLRADAGLRLMF